MSFAVQTSPFTEATALRGLAYLECIEPTCGAIYDAGDRMYTCERCHGLLDVKYHWKAGMLDGFKRVFDERRNSNNPLNVSGVWRFRELLPFFTATDQIVTLQEGNTPLWEAPRSANYAGLKRLTFKHQGMNPTGSFKDNGMTTGATQGRRLGARAVACASTGNTSASLAAYAARAGMRGIVFIPGGQIAYGKLSQSLDYGAVTLQIDGNFDDAMRIVRDLAATSDIYLLNSVNPFRLEGQKAIAIEMMQQRGWNAPDRVVVPGGNLGNCSALGKGFREMLDHGLIDRMPKLTVVQAEGAAPLAAYWNGGREGGFIPVEHPKTLATAIKIGQPVSWPKAVRALDWMNGNVVTVSEQEIADAKAMIGRDGLGCEPASATTLAGIRKLVESDLLDRDEDVIAVLTGNVLKDPDYTVQYHADELFTDAERESRTVRAEGKLASNFANRPVRVSANRDDILRVIQELTALEV